MLPPDDSQWVRVPRLKVVMRRVGDTRAVPVTAVAVAKRVDEPAPVKRRATH
ncbi:MAG: hypothetical protein AAGA54_14180 [Myxococcota bacterium]